jgi:hypothetical protein
MVGIFHSSPKFPFFLSIKRLSLRSLKTLLSWIFKMMTFSVTIGWLCCHTSLLSLGTVLVKCQLKVNPCQAYHINSWMKSWWLLNKLRTSWLYWLITIKQNLKSEVLF